LEIKPAMTKRLLIIGFILLVPYGYALSLKNLRAHTVGFELVFFAAFVLYALGVWSVLRSRLEISKGQIILIFAFAIAFRAILVFSQPRLSDDMYRYVWDGRVQAKQINPYLYPPEAPELAGLRDSQIWPLINRKSAVTVYPAGAELAYAAIWRIWPDNVHWYQVVMAAGDLLAGVLLFFLLHQLGRSELAVLIYLWSPLVIFETAHSAHVDGLVLPLIVGAWLARVRGRDGLTGLLLGAATGIKLYPLLLLPILWRLRDSQGRFRPAVSTPLAFLAAFALPYLPYLSAGKGVLGYLPVYFQEQFNPGLTHFISEWVRKAGGNPEQILLLLMAAVLLAIYAISLLRPDLSKDSAIRRCIWPIGAFTLLTRNLFPWYMLWLVPLVAIFLTPGERFSQAHLGKQVLNSWTGWWLFSGLVVLAYTFFIDWKPIPWVSWIQYLPLYAFLGLDLARWLRKKGVPRLNRFVVRSALGSSRVK
jgi:alpha-1,6-mannosyltransferase